MRITVHQLIYNSHTSAILHYVDDKEAKQTENGYYVQTSDWTCQHYGTTPRVTKDGAGVWTCSVVSTESAETVKPELMKIIYDTVVEERDKIITAYDTMIAYLSDSL